MTANVGTFDRMLRILIGAALIALAATGTIGAWGYIGALPLLTGLVRFCPAHRLLGLNTCATDRR